MTDRPPDPGAAPLREFADRLAGSLAGGGAALPFATLALDLFRRQFAANATYRRLCLAGGRTPETVGDWTGIPAVPTVAFKELELTSLPPAERIAVFHSSGTTGQVPSRHFHGSQSLGLYEASLVAGFARQTAAVGAVPRRFLALTPPPDRVPHSSLAHMFGVCARRFGTPDSVFVGQVGADGAWELDLPRLLGELEEGQRSGRPVLVLGTAFHFVHLIDRCAAGNMAFRLGEGSGVLETGGYKGRSREMTRVALHAAIAECLGVPSTAILREYGMSELSSQAYAPDSSVPVPGDASGEVFRFPPWARAVIISPETGREVAEGGNGLVRVLDLANVWSVLAVQTEDLAVRRGDGFELLGRVPRSEPRGCSLMAPA